MDDDNAGTGDPTHPSPAPATPGSPAPGTPAPDALALPAAGAAAPDTPAGQRPAPPDTTGALRSWWDGAADAYQAEHGEFLGDADFVWGPEGLTEERAGLLGGVAGRRVLELGCGAGQCGRWLSARGARVTGVDLSAGQLRHSRRLDRTTGTALPVVQGDGQFLPLRAEAFELAFSAYGALPFVADATVVLREVARVLRPGGRFVFSTTHPIRWAFPDDPGVRGLVAGHSYFDRSPYLEHDDRGRPTYAEYHRTMGDWVRDITAAGLVLTGLVEPEWPDGHYRDWDGWSRLRGRIIPGTAIFVCLRP